MKNIHVIIAVCFSLSLSQFGCAEIATATASGKRAFSSTVDWYHPPPEIPGPNGSISIPTELIKVVKSSAVNDAVALLTTSQIVDLSDAKLKLFAPGLSPDSILLSLVEDRRRKLAWFEAHPAKNWGLPAGADRSHIDGLNAEIDQFKSWKGHLKPYLIRAVALRSTRGFTATFVKEQLFVNQLSLGGAPEPMRRMPLVIFLPKKPQQIYTTVSMMD